VIIDNFALTMFQACPRKYFMRMREGWTARRKSAALGFGGAVHEGLATWYRTGNKVEALSAINAAWPDNSPVDDYRDKRKCIEVMTDYLREYPAENFVVVGAPDSPMIEKSFTIDTGLTLEDGEPIEYGGIFDGLVEFSGSVFVLEHKTTSQLGKTYFYQFRPNNQVSGYVWAASKLSGRNVGGAIINAIGVYKSSPTKFERNITSRTPAEISEWLLNVKNTCEMIRACERSERWPMFTQSCTMYGRCDFHSVCVLPHAPERQKMLEQDYMMERWEYEDRDDVP